MAKQFKTMGGRRSRYWCGPGIFRETKKAPVRGFIGQWSAPTKFLSHSESDIGPRPSRSRPLKGKETQAANELTMTTHDPIKQDNTTSRPALAAITPDATNGFVFSPTQKPHCNIPYTW
jgi:hypothetical protein